MIKIKGDRVTYFDVDGTLVIWDGPNYKPNKAIINSLLQHKERGHTIVVWSAGGADWAARVVEELGLEYKVDYVISKPSWYYDDLETKEFMPECNRFWFDDEGRKKVSKIVGLPIGYTDLVDEGIREKLKKEDNKFFPLRPSSAGYCSKRLAYDLMEYMGYGKYEKEPLTPDVYRLLNLGHSVEYSALKNLEMLEGFKLRYKQQVVTAFRLDSHDGSTPGPLIEGSIDVVLWSDNHKCVLDVKSQKDGHAVAYKTRWEETLDKYNRMESLQRIGDSAWYAENLDAFIKELGDDFLIDNLLQLNLYACTEFMGERGIDHAVILKYNKNTSQQYEIRFKPSRALFEQVRDKFNRVYKAVMDKKPELIEPDCKLGTMRAAFCPYKCHGPEALKAWFATFPPKTWAKKASEVKGVQQLFDTYEQLELSSLHQQKIEKEILDLMVAKKVLKIKLSNGNVYEAKFLKSPREHFELRRSKE